MHFFLNKYFVLRHITRLNKLVDYVHYFNMNVERFLQRDRIVSALFYVDTSFRSTFWASLNIVHFQYLERSRLLSDLKSCS